MIGKRYIDGDKLLDVIDPLDGIRSRVGLRQRVTSWLLRQPQMPKLIGRQRAAKILGVSSPYISVLVADGVMPKPIPVEGGKDAYIESEVKALAAKRKREAKAKAKEEAKV